MRGSPNGSSFPHHPRPLRRCPCHSPVPSSLWRYFWGTRTLAAESAPLKIRAALPVLAAVVLAAYAAPHVSSAGGCGGGKQGGFTNLSSSSSSVVVVVVAVVVVVVVASLYFSLPWLFAEAFWTAGGNMGLLPETSPFLWRRRRMRASYASSAFTTTSSSNATTTTTFADG